MYLMDDVKNWRAIYRLLNRVQTEVFDCGTLCGSACCMSHDEDNDMGIYLFPGEHKMFNLQNGKSRTADWLEFETQDPSELGFPPSWNEPVYFVRCKSAPDCERDMRPLQCRTFPLKPVIGDNGVLEMIWSDEDLPYKCPLIEGNFPIHDDYYKATYTAWTHLMRDKRIFDLVMMWSE